MRHCSLDAGGVRHQHAFRKILHILPHKTHDSFRIHTADNHVRFFQVTAIRFYHFINHIGVQAGPGNAMTDVHAKNLPDF